VSYQQEHCFPGEKLLEDWGGGVAEASQPRSKQKKREVKIVAVIAAVQARVSPNYKDQAMPHTNLAALRESIIRVDLASSGLHTKIPLLSPPPRNCRQNKNGGFVKMGCQLSNIYK
jgi:hypothetical protein